MPTIKTISDQDFETDILHAETPIIVDFYGENCSTCETIAQWFDDIEHELPIPVRKIFLSDPTSDLAQRYQLRGIPTLIRFENGVETARMAGQFSIPTFRSFVLDDQSES